MCQKINDNAAERQIEELHLQGMPRKVGRRVENTLVNKMRYYINKNGPDSNHLVRAAGEILDCSGDPIQQNFVISNKNFGTNQKKNSAWKGDLLAIVTQWIRKCIVTISKGAENVKNSKNYKLFFQTTQPTHLVAVSIIMFVLIVIWPNLQNKDERLQQTAEISNGLFLVTYLGAFATHFGSQIWMTFVSGLSLYFSLPRHTFGLCQQILFPKYFAINAILSILTLIMFVKCVEGRWECTTYVQVMALALCAAIEVVVRLYLTPSLLLLMREKYKFEVSLNSGKEIGQLDQSELLKCPHYQKIHKAFRRIHSVVSMGNLMAMTCMFLHLHYLASRIRIS